MLNTAYFDTVIAVKNLENGLLHEPRWCSYYLADIDEEGNAYIYLFAGLKSKVEPLYEGLYYYTSGHGILSRMYYDGKEWFNCDEPSTKYEFIKDPHYLIKNNKEALDEYWSNKGKAGEKILALYSQTCCSD